MRSHFISHQKTALLGLSIVLSVMVTMSVEEFTANANKLTDFYKYDLPFQQCFHSELDCWKLKWKQHLTEHGHCSLPSSPTTAFKQATSVYPNIRVLVTILCTLPVTSCSAERFLVYLRNLDPAIFPTFS